MGPVRVFLDANIVFSAALGGASFDLLWDCAAAGKVELLTSVPCAREAEFNLELKQPSALAALWHRLERVGRCTEGKRYRAWARTLVSEKDVHVLAAARGYKAEVLVTGDRRHFGPLMRAEGLGLRVRTVRAFLLEGPQA